MTIGDKTEAEAMAILNKRCYDLSRSLDEATAIIQRAQSGLKGTAFALRMMAHGKDGGGKNCTIS